MLQLNGLVRPGSRFSTSLFLVSALTLPAGSAADENKGETNAAGPKQAAAKTPGGAGQNGGGSNLLKRIREASEPILAEMAEKHGYRLRAGESIHRVPTPFDPIRMTYYRVGNPSQAQAIPAGPSAITFHWDGKRLRPWGMTFGGSSNGGYSLVGLADAIQGIKSQQIQGPPDLLNESLPGDWVSRPRLSDDIFARELQAILQEDLKLPIRLEFRTHTRQVYVATGRYRFVPLPGQRAQTQLNTEQKSETMSEVQIFGKQLVPNSGAGGGSGDFREFLSWLGRWIETPILDDVRQPPGQIAWTLHQQSPITALTTKQDHDPALVLHNIEAQTGLHFSAERRPVKTLFVERKQ